MDCSWKGLAGIDRIQEIIQEARNTAHVGYAAVGNLPGHPKKPEDTFIRETPETPPSMLQVVVEAGDLEERPVQHRGWCTHGEAGERRLVNPCRGPS